MDRFGMTMIRQGLFTFLRCLAENKRAVATGYRFFSFRELTCFVGRDLLFDSQLVLSIRPHTLYVGMAEDLSIG